MARSANIYTGDGVTTQFAVNFTLGFISRDDVVAYVEDELDGGLNQIYRTITWINDGLIDVGTAPADTKQVFIRRVMDKTALQHDFQDGAIQNEQSLDEANLQLLYIMHEILDGFYNVNDADTSDTELTIRADVDMQSEYFINNLLDPTTAQQAATKAYTDAVIATGAANAAATAADAIATAADAVATAADRVQTGLDVVATAADRVQTGLDATATAADLVQTNLDQIATTADASATAADLVQTNLDTIATAADRVQTGLDVVATNADAVSTAADAIATAADAAATAADLASFQGIYHGPLASDPLAGVSDEGDLYYNTVANELRAYDGAAWSAALLPSSAYVLVAGSTMTGNLGFNNGTSDTDGVIFQDGINNSNSYIDQASEQWRVFSVYRGGGAIELIKADMSTGKVNAPVGLQEAGVDLSTKYGNGAALKAFVGFDGAGTPTIHDSLNVSSITDLGVGDYKVNYTTNLSAANYAVTNGVEGDAIACVNDATAPMAVDSVGIETKLMNTSGSHIDCNGIGVAVFLN